MLAYQLYILRLGSLLMAVCVAADDAPAKVPPGHRRHSKGCGALALLRLTDSGNSVGTCRLTYGSLLGMKEAAQLEQQTCSQVCKYCGFRGPAAMVTGMGAAPGKRSRSSSCPNVLFFWIRGDQHLTGCPRSTTKPARKKAKPVDKEGPVAVAACRSKS